MIDRDGIIRIYTKYGFALEEETQNALVFSYNESIFPGVDIVIEDANKYDCIREKYSQCGFSTNIVHLTSACLIDEALYKRFLKPEKSKEKLFTQYNEYTQKIAESYSNEYTGLQPYRYMEVPYTYERNFKTIETSDGLVDLLMTIIQEKGPKLIIVEAAAGYGKTSTSYELLKRLCESHCIFRPFLMELERDRQASTFHYLLLSQIERQFEIQLRNDIVIDNIKAGRIPVIIDGFDELLSLDLDKGYEAISFDGVKTMLSTIAQLLEGNSKIVLTTRKTATFNGEQFTDWFNYQRENLKRNFDIERIQLLSPNIKEWIDPSKLKMLPSAIDDLSNPVLLSFLHYTDIEGIKDINSAEILVERYLDFLYTREKKRQHLPLKSEEQEEVMKVLASYFCVFDITADRREGVKDIIQEEGKDIIKKYADSSEDYKAIVNKLVNHALLDRHSSGLVGFINDFILGTLMRKAFASNCKILEEADALSLSCVKRIIDASNFLDAEKKIEIANALKVIPKQTSDIRFLIDHQLSMEIGEPYHDKYVTETTFNSVLFGPKGTLKNFTFTNCKFEECRFEWSSFDNCCFINCRFINTMAIGAVNNNELYDCESENSFLIPDENYVESPLDKNDKQPYDIDRLILLKFRRVGQQIDKVKHISSIIREMSGEYTRKQIMKQISKLKSSEYIYVNGDVAWILQKGSDYLNKQM